MQRHRAACGCELGSIFTLIAVIGLGAYLITGQGGPWSGLGTLARGLTWVVSMSVAGKVLGLGYARLRLIQLGRELERSQTRIHSFNPPPLTRTE